ncbi:MAG: hypothetical protein RMJ67_06425 [Elusimicrobiota bacterium]|nr:hypothetical protein [Endomicrobiia bacterium]MDW8166129.1 hypothetical protein [Elusimicrobiota bacterium]
MKEKILEIINMLEILVSELSNQKQQLENELSNLKFKIENTEKLKQKLVELLQKNE